MSQGDEWREVRAPLHDVVAEVVLRGQRGDVVTIVEGDDPDDPARTPHPEVAPLHVRETNQTIPTTQLVGLFGWFPARTWIVLVPPWGEA